MPAVRRRPLNQRSIRRLAGQFQAVPFQFHRSYSDITCHTIIYVFWQFYLPLSAGHHAPCFYKPLYNIHHSDGPFWFIARMPWNNPLYQTPFLDRTCA